MMQRRAHRNYVRGILTALFVVGAGVFLFAASASAQGGIIPECDWAAGETYGLGAFTKLALNVLKFIWGILGSLALVMFVWGGFLWLTARGEENQIKQGWDTLVNAVIGLLIVLGSWLIINTIILALTDPGQWHVARVFQQDWSELVREDVCVKVAAHVKSTGIGKGAVGSSAAGGDGVCCYLSPTSGGMVLKFETGSLDACEEGVRSRFADNKALYCAGATDQRACGEAKATGGGSVELVNPNCDGKEITITRVALDDRCGKSSSKIDVCEPSYNCEPNSPSSDTRCVDPDEQVLCCVYADAKVSGTSEEKIIRVSAPTLNRKACVDLAKGSVPSKITDSSTSKEWTTTFNEALACSNIPAGGDCLKAATGANVLASLGGLGVTAGGVALSIVSIPLIPVGGAGAIGTVAGAGLIAGGASIAATGLTNIITGGAVPKDSCRVIK